MNCILGEKAFNNGGKQESEKVYSIAILAGSEQWIAAWFNHRGEYNHYEKYNNHRYGLFGRGPVSVRKDGWMDGWKEEVIIQARQRGGRPSDRPTDQPSIHPSIYPSRQSVSQPTSQTSEQAGRQATIKSALRCEFYYRKEGFPPLFLCIDFGCSFILYAAESAQQWQQRLARRRITNQTSSQPGSQPAWLSATQPAEHPASARLLS